MLTKLVAVGSQYAHIWNHYVIHLELIQCSMSIIFKNWTKEHFLSENKVAG